MAARAPDEILDAKGGGFLGIDLGAAAPYVGQSLLWIGVGLVGTEVATDILTTKFSALGKMASTPGKMAAARGVVGLGISAGLGFLMLKADPSAAKKAIPLMLLGATISALRDVAIQPALDKASSFIRGVLPTSLRGGGITLSSPNVLRLAARRAAGAGDYPAQIVPPAQVFGQTRDVGQPVMPRAGGDVGIGRTGGFMPINTARIARTEIGA